MNSNLSNLPVIGPWARRVGQVQQIMAIPCSVTPEIWVEAFFYSVPIVAWTLFFPDPTDVGFSRGGQPHHRGKRPQFNIQKIITAESLARYGGLGLALFRAGEIANFVGWTMLIIDAGTKLAVMWTSTAYEWAGCLPDHHCYCTAKVTPTQRWEPGSSQYVLWDPVDDTCNMMAVLGVDVPAGMSPGIGVSLSVVPFPETGEDAGDVTISIVKWPSGEVVKKGKPPTRPKPGPYQTGILWQKGGREPLLQQYRVVVETSRHWAQCSVGSLSASSVIDRSILPFSP